MKGPINVAHKRQTSFLGNIGDSGDVSKLQKHLLNITFLVWEII